MRLAISDQSVNAAQTARLDGISLPFAQDTYYQIMNMWLLQHPEDINSANNDNKGEEEYFKGKDFLSTGWMSGKMCH